MQRPLLVVAAPALALILWFFAPALAGGSSFAFRDAADYYHPLFEWTREQWAAGVVPLWNPHENLGVPLVADNTSSLFYPGKLLFALPLDFTLLYNAYIVGHVALAAAAAYCLARHWQATPAAASLAAVSYAFGGNVVFQYCNVVFLVGAAWLPLAVLAADRALRLLQIGGAVALGVVLAMMVTGGDPQMAYNVLLLAALYALLLWRDERPQRFDPFRRRGVPPAARAAPQRAFAGQVAPAGQSTVRLPRRPLLLGLAAVVGGLLAAVQILPTLEASPGTSRAMYDAPRNVYELVRTAAGSTPSDPRLPWYSGLLGSVYRGHQRQIYHFSVSPWRLAELCWPNVSGRAFPTDRRWLAALRLEANLWTPSLYMGLLPAGLAVSAWSLRRQAPIAVRWMSWTVLLGGLASFGHYGLAWLVGQVFGGAQLVDVGGEVGGLYWWMTLLLPSYVQFRYPAKLFVVAALGLSMLAASGWDRLWQSPATGLRRALAALSGVSLLLLAVVPLVWHQVEARIAELPPDPATPRFNAAGARHDLATALVHTAVVAGVLAAALRPRIRQRHQATAAVVLAISIVDLAVANRYLVVYAPAASWRYEPPIIAQLPPQRDDYRVYRKLNAAPPPSEQPRAERSLAELLLRDRDSLWPKHQLPYGVSLVEALTTLRWADYETVLDLATQYAARRRLGPLPDQSILDLLGARVAIAQDDLPLEGRPLVPPPAAGLQAVVRSSALPRAWIVHAVERVDTPHVAAPWQLRRHTSAVLFPDEQPRDWRRLAVVECDPADLRPLEPPPAEAVEHCRLVRAEPLAIELDVRLVAAGVVVLSDRYDPDWRLEVETDGTRRAAPIVRANRVMRGVFLPAGDHRLRFDYRPASVYWGAAVSGLSVLLLAAGTALAAWRRRVRGPAGQI